MDSDSTRRQLIRAVGTIGTATLAGCSSLFGPDSSPSPFSPESTESSATTESGPFNRGTVVDDFEGEIGKRWQIDYGEYATTGDAYQGSQAVVLRSRSPKAAKKAFPYARITNYFSGNGSEPLDLSDKDLSMAVKVKKPTPDTELGNVKITAKLFAPTNSISVVSNRSIPLELDDWVRFDLGYTGVNGEPTMDEILAMQIIIDSRKFTNYAGQSFEILIDDIRTIPKPKRGTVLLQFDDSHETAYTQAFELMKEKGIPGSVGTIPSAVGARDRLSRSQMIEMNNAGWEMICHPQTGQSLPRISKEGQEKLIKRAYQTLSALGFENGARHFVAPYSRVDSTTLSIVEKYHKTGFLFGGCPNNASQPSNPYFISRVQGGDVRGTKQLVDMAERFNQLTVISYHTLGSGPNALPIDQFEEVLDYISSKDVVGITPSQLIAEN